MGTNFNCLTSVLHHKLIDVNVSYNKVLMSIR